MTKKQVFHGIAFWLFHVTVAAYAGFLILAASVHAQSPSTYQGLQITELERRVTSLEALNLEHRLTEIETLLRGLQDGNVMNRFTMGGTGLLLAERVAQAIRRKGGSDSDSENQ